MKRLFSFTNTPLLAAMLVAVFLLIIPGVAAAQEETTNIPRFICTVSFVDQTCTQNNNADEASALPKSVTSCSYQSDAGDGGSDDLRECKTVFEGGAEQVCRQNVNRNTGVAGNWRCTGTNPSTGETYSNESTNVAVKVVGGAAGFVADAANTAIVKPIVMFILTFAGWVLGVAGVFFNWVVIKTVFQFATYFGTTDSMLLAWGVIRDIANIGLLFGFILMGVLLILNVDGGGHGHGGGISARRAIPRLIIFAVLLNFSLFASQAVIDIANAFGSSFTTLAGEPCASAATTPECANDGIAGRIIQMAGIGTIWNDGVTKAFETSTVTLLGMALFVTITAIVLIAAAIMLVFRVVVLTLLMITSPIGFAGMVIPGLGSLASRWWKLLISQSFFAPVMLLLIFVSLKMAESLNPGGEPLVNAFAEANSGLAGNLEVLVVFAVVIGLMIASLTTASKMGAMGASFATNSASALVFGTMTRGTNFAVGGGARALRVAQQRTGIGGKAGEVAVNRFIRPLEKTNLDLRRLPGASAGLGAAGISAGAKAAEHATYADMAHQFSDIKAGKTGQKLNREYETERSIGIIDSKHGANLNAADKSFLKTLSTKDLAKLHSLNQLAGELSGSQFDALMKDKDLLTDDQKDGLKSARAKSLAASATAGTLTMAQLESAMKNDSFNAAEKNTIKNAQLAALSGRAAAMTADEFESILKSSAFEVADKESLKEGRSAAVAASLATGNTATIKAAIEKLSKQDLENLPTAILTQPVVLDALSDKQRDDLTGSNKRTTQEKEAVKATYSYARINEQFKIAGGGGAAADAAAAAMINMMPEQVAKLDVNILISPQASGALKPAVLGKLLDENKLTVGQMEQIGKNIRSNPAAMSDPKMKTYLEGAAGSVW